MRISTNTIYQSGISKINSLQSDQVKLQQQISTGRRISAPSDDPVAAARILELSQAKQANNAFADTRQTAQIKLNTIESNLTSVTSLLIASQSSLIGAANGTLSDADRGNVAKELSGSLGALLGLANTKDSYGNFLYAGFKTDTSPFVANLTGATYMGDSNQQLLQVDSQRQLATSVSGDRLFQANGNDVFATLANIVTLLNTPITDAVTQATFSAGMASAISSLQGSVDNILNVRASVGFSLNELDTLDNYGADRDLQYAKSLSDLQDTDYASALSDLAKSQTIMEAAQKSFVATTSLSLFDFI
jgi:flagellar hook-associated protein 3 FlgL